MSTSPHALVAEGPGAAPPPNVLEYQQSSRARRWRRSVTRWTGRLVVPALILGIAGAGWWWREWIADWFGWQMAMRAAWRHEMPAERASILVNGDKAKRLASESDDYVLDEYGYAVYQPAALRRLAQYDWRCKQWDFGPQLLSGTELSPVAFMGVMRRPDGKQRLVVITGGGANALGLLENVRVLILEPPSLWGSERLAGVSQSMIRRTGQVRGGVIHMGHLDPQDPSRLLLPFSAYGVNGPSGSGLIELRLENDDTLRACIIENRVTHAPDWIGCAERISMPAAGGTPFTRSPWRSKTVAAQMAVFRAPSTRPVDW